MLQTLTRHGDGLALLLDQSILDQLKIDADTPLSVTVAGNTLVVSPVAGPDDDERRRRFEEAKRETFERYDGVFRRLAE